MLKFPFDLMLPFFAEWGRILREKHGRLPYFSYICSQITH
jgi:hypothetical protein